MTITSIIIILLLSISLPYALILDDMHRRRQREQRKPRNKKGHYTAIHMRALASKRSVRLIRVNEYGETRYITAR